MLSVDIVKQLGDFKLTATFESAGPVTGLFGNSGTGKTSIINLIAGLVAPDRGTIVLDGEPLDDTERGIHVPPHLRRIGYVFQDARLFPHLDVRRNLDFGRRMNGLTRDAAHETRIVALLDIADLLGRRPAQLSGGERHRVALGRALLAKPRLLLLDEPTEGLAPVIVQQIGRTIGELKARGFTILLVEQNFRFAATVADRHYVMEHGRVVDMIPNEALGASMDKLHDYLGV